MSGLIFGQRSAGFIPIGAHFPRQELWGMPVVKARQAGRIVNQLA
jgi:hypothetical protein